LQPLDEMAAGLAHPNKLIGVHYMQPAEAWPCVELIRCAL
jgi:3-hydroxyacyl-CoA dehydrogenase